MRGVDVVTLFAPCLLAGCDHAPKGAAKSIAFEIDNARKLLETERAHVALMKATNANVCAAGIRAEKAATAFKAIGTPEQARALVAAVSELMGHIRRLEMPPEN